MDRQGGWSSIAGELAEIPDDPLTHQRRTLEALADILSGAPAAPAEDRLAAALIDARQLAYMLRRLADDVAPPLRARALGLATAMREGLTRYWSEIL